MFIQKLWTLDKTTWTLSLGEGLQWKTENNVEDLYAVAVTQRNISAVVGHVPLARYSSTIHYTVSGVRCLSVDLAQGGLEVPCRYRFSL